MDIKRCFEILELDRGVSPDKAKQAYKDMVNIWHPDRFSNNPRLKQKAEEKLKDINVAYETLNSYLSSRQWTEPYPKKTEPAAATGTMEGKKDNQNPQPEAQPYDKTEAIVEAGTGIVMRLWSNLSSIFRHIAADIKAETNPGNLNQPQRNTADRGGMRRGKGRGRGIGKGGGMRGRGRR